MHYQPTLPENKKVTLLKLWGFEGGELLDITAFGDIFIRHNNDTFYISLTDGEITQVNELIEEFGLPPVSLDLGDEWYQLSAQNQLKEAGFKLANEECFGFSEPVFSGGEYSPENIQTFDILEYHQTLHPLISNK